jgi:hypothetical protein
LKQSVSRCPIAEETIAERNGRVVREAALSPRIDGPFDCAADLVAAQSRVMTLMALGSMLPHVGKTFIESLALMARTRELIDGGATGVIRIEGNIPDLVVEDAAPAIVDTPPVVPLKKGA